MSRKKPIIALAQIRYFDISKSNNVEKIKKYIQLAAKAKADIVCFPESCVTKSDVLHFNHKHIQEIRAECKKNSIWCIISEDMAIGRKSYNVAMLIDRKGEIRGGYKKIHLLGDKTHAGKSARVFKTDFAKIGIVICWDLAFPELFRKLKEAGAQIVFCPAQWWFEKREWKRYHKARELKRLKSIVATRAFENLFFVALCNPVIDTKKQMAYSAIACPHRIKKEIIGKEGLITMEINLNEIKQLRKIYESNRTDASSGKSKPR